MCIYSYVGDADFKKYLNKFFYHFNEEEEEEEEKE